MNFNYKNLLLPLIILLGMSAIKAADMHTGTSRDADSTEPLRSIFLEAKFAALNNSNLRSTANKVAPLEFIKTPIAKLGNSYQATIGFSKQGRPVLLRFFPGRTDKKALVIGGVHGTELSAIEVAMRLIQRLENATEVPEYSLLVIPELFPDNAAAARLDPASIGSSANIGRYTTPTSVDPNRQMPALGKAYDQLNPVDGLGRPIEAENQMLLSVIRDYAPDRIVNLHAIRDPKFAGVFADPRTDENLIAKGFDTDSVLAINMAKYIARQSGVKLKGNRLEAAGNALYLYDPVIAPAGSFQKRNASGSCLNGGRGNGVSLGGWASTAVHDHPKSSYSRDAMILITMEFPGCRRPQDYVNPIEQALSAALIDAFAASIQEVFLMSNE